MAFMADVDDIVDIDSVLLDDSDEPPGEPRDSLTGPTQPKRTRRTAQGGATARKRKSASRPPVAGTRELAQLLAKLIGGSSILLALFLSIDEAAMTEGEARDIARPAARMLAKSSFAAQLLSVAGRGGDAIALTMALASYGLRIYPLIVQRQQLIEAQRRQQSGTPGAPYAQPSPAASPVRSEQAQPKAQPAAGSGASAADIAARAAADAVAFAGAGFADPDALANGARGDIAALVRAHPTN